MTLLPKEVTDRLGSEDVETLEEPGRVLISPVVASPGRAGEEHGGEVDPILSMGDDPVDDEITDVSENHDRYLYTGAW